MNEDQLRDAINAADIVVSRAGSGSIFELALFAKPSVLIPIKKSASDHQRLNAVEYFKAGCCIYFEEGNLLPNLFLTQITELLIDTEKKEKMAISCKEFSRPGAAEIIAKEVLRLAGASS